MNSFVNPQKPLSKAESKNPRMLKLSLGVENMMQEMAKINVGSSSNTQPSTARLIPRKTQAVEQQVSTAKHNPESVSKLIKPPSCKRHEGIAAISCTPREALEQRGSLLSAFEKEEILGYDCIYYVADCRKVPTNPKSPNQGFDDDNGDYRVMVDDHIAYRYQVLHELGRGSFGQVSKAVDHKSKELVALKIIKNRKKFHEQALIEVDILKKLRENDLCGTHHVVKILEHFFFRNHMVIAFELHGINLYELCKANRFAPLPGTTIRIFAIQLLSTLSYLHSLRIVHCDLKPENILLRKNSKTHIQVIDFGSSCYEQKKLYTYIQSRFYRAPEVMLGIPYTTAIDMWSFGCILAELANGYPIFPGESEGEQMLCIMEFLGVPPWSLIEKAPRRKNFFDSHCNPIMAPNSRGKMRRVNSKDISAFLRSALKDSDAAAMISFIQRCLEWDPVKRWSPTEAMEHPWFSGTGQLASLILPKIHVSGKHNQMDVVR